MPSKDFEIKVESILNGIAPSFGFSGDGQYNSALGVDSDFPASDSGVQPSGYIRPTAMEKFSGANVDSAPLWLLTNPKDTNIYAFLNNGTFVSYNSSLASETKVTGLPNSTGNGGAYYDNYIYLGHTTNISRYGPLNGTPLVNHGYWITGLSKTALTNTTYPSIRGITMPNHVMHKHTDSKLYFIDVLGDTAVNTNKGTIHAISTTKTTVEGDTNNGSAWNALDLDYGEYPTALASYQTSLAIGVIEGTNTTVRQGNAKVFFWDTTSSSFQLEIDDEFVDPLITAMLNVNGILYVASGSATGGCRISRYVGGYTHEEVWYNQDVFPPLQGAFADLLKRVVFGSATTYPEASASVFAIGGQLTQGTHNILRANAENATPYATSLLYAQNSALPLLSPIVGWKDASTFGISKLSTTYGISVWRSPVYRIGEWGQVDEIEIPLGVAMGANMTITPKVICDDSASSTTLNVINNTNYPNSDKNVSVFGPVVFEKDFFIELRWTGSALCPVALPIIIKGRTIR